MKRLLFIATILLTALAASAISVDGISYGFNDDTMTANVAGLDYGSTITQLVIPSQVTYNGKTYTVTEISTWAFQDNTNLTSATIPNTVTTIGNFAFRNCTSLSTISIPASVYNIGQNCFSNTAWLDSQPDGIVYAGKVAYVMKGNTHFYTKYTFKDDCTGIASRFSLGYGSDAMRTWLEEVTIGDNVKFIGDNAFCSCYNMKKATIGNSVETISYGAFTGCSALQEITIPASVTTMYHSVFHNCVKLEKATFLNTPVSLPETIFEGCTSLTTVDLGNKIPSIGGGAFKGCTALTSFTAPASLKEIGVNAFKDCSSLSTVKLTKAVTQIGNDAFAGTAWYNNQSDGMVYAGYMAYKYKGDMPANTSITLKDDCIGVASSAFAGQTNLKAITLKKGVTNFNSSAFNGCTGLTRVNIEDLTVWCGIDFTNQESNPLYYGQNLYVNGSLLTDLTIPSTITSLKNHTFVNCTSLKRVTVPARVTEMKSAFNGCTELTRVDISDLAAWCKVNFSSANANPLYYGKNLYLNEGLVTKLVIPASVDTVRGYTFRNCASITEVTIPNTVTRVNNYAFEGCTELKTVTWDVPTGNDFSYINHPFRRVTSIETFIFGNSVTKIPGSLCNSLTGITRVVIPASVKTIGRDAFANCTGLTRVDISDLAAWCGIDFGNATASPLYCGKNLYLNDNMVTALAIPGEVATVKPYAFYGCESITSASFPATVTAIGAQAFKDCTGLTQATARIGEPQSLTYGANVFSGIPAESTLYVPAGTGDVYRLEQYGDTANPWLAFSNVVEWTDGDVNFDGAINTGDVSSIYRFILIGEGNAALCDLNGDGEVNTGDVSKLYKIILGQ